MIIFTCTASALVVRDKPAGKDTGKRVLNGQNIQTFGESWDKNWLNVTTATGEDGWVSRHYMTPSGVISAPLPKWPKIPHGLVAIRNTFGEAGNPDCTKGVVTLPAPLILAWDPTKRVRRFNCHILLEDLFTSFFSEIHRQGYWHLLEDFGGCYNYRKARKLQKLSTHSWGIAVDLNVASNPLGARPNMPLEIVAIAEDHGLLWGGRWSRPDAMHFQAATGY